jgi:hypothetical protein
VRFLLDEQLSDLTARTMGVLGHPDVFEFINNIGGQGTQDPDIPELCRSGSFDVLISVNVKDFGARRHIYEALVAAGVHVLVMRTKGQPPTNYWQVSVLARHFQRYRKIFTGAESATLAVLNEGGVREVTLDELIADIEAEQQAKSRRRLP